ncbi:MAG: MG2 domain-containing protein [Pseudomonadota bacterium]
MNEGRGRTMGRAMRGILAMLALAALAAAGFKGQGDAMAGPKDETVKVAKKTLKSGRLALVMNYPYQITGEGRTKIHVTLFMPDFKPAAGAVVKVNGKKVGVADENGTCIFDYVPGSNSAHKLVATLTREGTLYRTTKHFQSNARTESFRSDQLFVYTDRGVYNPGDTIHVRMLAWELLGVYTALPGAEVTVLFQEPGGRVFGGEKLKTDADGVAALELPLPKNMPLGNYELKVLYNKAAETARLRVERFQPPVMNIKHDLKRFLTPAQETLMVSVGLTYFSGGIPEGATMNLAALAPGGEVLLEKAFESDKIGRYGLTLDKKDLDTIRKALQPEQAFQMQLTAKDGYGRTSEVKRDIVYTEMPYRAVLECDKDDYPAGETVVLTARVVDLDGRPAKEIVLTMQLEGTGTKVTAKTDEAGVAEFRFAMGKEAAQAVVRSELMGQPLGQRQIRLNSAKPMVSKVNEPPKKEGISTHIDVTFHPDYVPVEKVVHVDLTDTSGGLVASTTIPVKQRADGLWTAGGTVKADTWGTMLANLYVVAAHKKDAGKRLTNKSVGFITEGQHVTLLPGVGATITLRNLKPKVRPGELLDLIVDVKTRSGEEAALGASMVDQAVISLMDPLETTPGDHFYNPQRKVISTGGAGVLTWPVVDRNWGNPWRDIAYTNWGFKDPGGWVSGQDQGDMDGSEALQGAVGSGMGGSGSGAGSIVTKSAGVKGPSKKPKMLLKSADAPAPPASMAMEKKKVQYEFSDVTVDGELMHPSAEPMPMEEAEAAADEDGFHEGDDRTRRRDDGPAKAKDAPKQITIRTDFPETALWAPKLRTENGTTRMKIRIPDSITVQELTLVASDRKGGVGVLRQPITVHQEVFVRLSPPATMVLGDAVQVQALIRNVSDQDLAGTVSFSSSDVALAGDAAEVPVKIPAGESTPVTWLVKPLRTGEAKMTVKVSTPSVEDSETRATFVLPAGDPEVTVLRGTVKKGGAFEESVKLRKRSTYRTAFLNVSFPNLVPALQGWEALAEWPLAWVGVTGVASRAITDAAMLDWGTKAKKDAAWFEHARSRLARAGIALAASQQEDGSWGWFYLADAALPAGGYHGSTYMTAYALRALLEIKAADFVVDDKAIQGAITWLYGQRNDKGVWSVGPAYFWEVNAPEADWGLSAELMALLVSAERVVNTDPSADLKKLVGMMEDHLAGAPADPATLAWGVMGLTAWAEWQKNAGAAKLAKTRIQQLLTMKRDGYWEPHWYHAYGGMVELNALILRVLAEDDAEAHAGTIREIVTWLLSTREAWGAWHNEIGTATAVRALLRAGAGAIAEIPSVVTVRVDGEQVARVDIDPADPFLSAASLRHLEITGNLKPGKNEVRVSYDGALTAAVTLEVREWGKDVQGATGPEVFSVVRKAAKDVKVNQPTDVTLEVSANRKAPYVQVTDGIPANATPDTASLDALVEAGTVQGYDVGQGEVTFFLKELVGEASLSYKLVASRPGAAGHPGARVNARFHPAFGSVWVVGDALTVTD